MPKLCLEGLNRVDREFPDLSEQAYPPLLTTLAYAQWRLEDFGAASDTYARLAAFGAEHGGAPEDVEFAWEGHPARPARRSSTKRRRALHAER